MKTSTSSPKTPPAKASELPHCPAPGLGDEALHAGLLVVEGLRHGGVGLVAAGGRDALVLVVDARRGLQRLLEAPGPVEGRGAPLPVDVAHRPGNLDLALGGDLLEDQLHREERRQVVRADGLLRPRMQHRRQGLRQVGRDVVPGLRDASFVEDVLDGVVHDQLSPEMDEACLGHQFTRARDTLSAGRNPAFDADQPAFGGTPSMRRCRASGCGTRRTCPRSGPCWRQSASPEAPGTPFMVRVAGS